MNGYFVNNELRRSSAIFLGLMVLFLLTSLLIVQHHHQHLKTDYIKILGVIAARMAELDPELVDEIIPLITKGASPGRIQTGQEFLKEYGLTPDLADGLFPYLQPTFHHNFVSVVLMIGCLTIVFFLLNYYQYVFFYRRLRRITLGAKRLVEGDDQLQLPEEEEGDFSKLANAFNSMRKIILNQLEQLKKEKQFLVDLLADISHQLKTPLSSLVVYNDIMLQQELSPTQSEGFLLKKEEQLARMNWLIDRILKLARLDAKAIDFDRQVRSLNQTVSHAIAAVESKASLGRVTVVYQQAPAVCFNHDHLWLEEALINILKNGIEHTAAGGQITISLTENPLFRRITIEDTGEGIAREELAKVFQRFYKIPNAKKSGSLGIGLALARSIIEAHDGVIEVQSQPNIGTRFIITFIK